MENFLRYKMVGGNILMKANVVPHIFDCQKDRKRASTHADRPAAVKRVKRKIVEEAVASSSPQDISAETSAENISVAEVDTFIDEISSKRDIGMLAKPHVRSKSIQCHVVGESVALSPFKQWSCEIATSPFKLPLSSEKFQKVCTLSITSGSTDQECSEESDTLQVESQSSDSEEEMQSERFKIMCQETTCKKLKLRPRLYMGLPNHAFYVFQLLEKYCKLESVDIFLTLKKIRTGRSFAELADDFGISDSTASRKFANSLPHIEKCLRKCVLKPNISTVKTVLPLAFRARYNNVLCIIDCLEIEIEKPSDALKQSLTWSDYKKCNTLKYLISSTPDGVINYISTGFGGRASDAVIVEHSGFLDILEPGTAVMADRGFKHIEHLLLQKRCTLVRPPSVSTSTKSTKSDVLETKRIASLRIHIERVIRRIREFSFLEPHACIDNKSIPYTNLIIKIVCGLVNLQSALIRGK